MTDVSLSSEHRRPTSVEEIRSNHNGQEFCLLRSWGMTIAVWLW
jgi:hypothetical protein